MNKGKWNKDNKSVPYYLTALTFIITALILLSGAYSPSLAKRISQKSFASPEEAVRALVVAVRADDIKGMLAILGPGGKKVISSGDEVADKTGREKFLKAYDEKNKLEESADKLVLHVGANDWPLPIPIVKKDNTWIFDTKAAKEEILNRRIGRNELNVIEVLHAHVDAQREYASKDCKGDGAVEFAQKFISTKGKRDGLYWEAKEGEEMSPLGPLVAQAAKEGYAKQPEGFTFAPYHGYYYKILKEQGEHATGGSYNYVVKGKMILGFALVAYPAKYGNSGIMTFIVNQEGIIYEKNLGKNTESIAKAMKIFDPDETWKKVEEIPKH
ncbi:MAG: DUF2950 domain-containing protein [Nitrospirota bacterium]|nr:DUF2950 domain-containing protein [Nitrospirota bacterium]